MEFVSVRVITDDVERLATFWERVTGLPAARPVPVFAEFKTPAGTIAIGAPATVGMLGAAALVPGQNRSVFIELRVDDVDATWERVKSLVPQTVPEIVLEPTDMPWGNRSVILRDPDGGLVNLFTPVTPEATSGERTSPLFCSAARQDRRSWRVAPIGGSGVRAQRLRAGVGGRRACMPGPEGFTRSAAAMRPRWPIRVGCGAARTSPARCCR